LTERKKTPPKFLPNFGGFFIRLAFRLIYRRKKNIIAAEKTLPGKPEPHMRRGRGRWRLRRGAKRAYGDARERGRNWLPAWGGGS
jgi:hypothetical protein